MPSSKTTISEKKKVVIIGGGIVGVSTAVWLQREGHDVTIVDRLGIAEGTSYGNGGVLASCGIVPVTGPGLLLKAPVMLLNPNQPLFMKWGYLPKLLPWLAQYLKHANVDDTKRIAAALNEIIGDSLADHEALCAGTGAERYLVRDDYWYVYKQKSDFDAERFSWDIRRHHGFQWDQLTGDALRKAAPDLDPSFQFGVRLPNHGRITDPGAYVRELANHVISKGGKFIKADVQDFQLQDGALHSVIVNSQAVACDAVILATGVWSSPLMKKFGLRANLESERGYHLELWEPSAMPKSPMMIASAKFVVTPMEGRIRCAGILEFGGLEAEPSQAPFELLERSFREAFPSITWKTSQKWMGHRPATTDSIPVIGELNSAKGVFAGFGHHHVGLTGGPKTGRILSQLVSGKKPNLDLAPYSPMRFQ